jgi:hypothetical protein
MQWHHSLDTDLNDSPRFHVLWVCALNCIILLYITACGAWGSIVVKALHYYLDCPGIDSGWCHL